MGYDPSTIAIPRDPTTGVFDPSNTETAPYNTGTWGTPFYERIGREVFVGEVLGRIFDVTPGFDGCFVGDNPYWCGFWLYREAPGECGFNVNIVKPDGSYIDYAFETPFPVYDPENEDQY